MAFTDSDIAIQRSADLLNPHFPNSDKRGN